LAPLCRASTVAEIRYALEFVLQHFKTFSWLVYLSINTELDSFMLNPRLLIFVSALKEIHLFNVHLHWFSLCSQDPTDISPKTGSASIVTGLMTGFRFPARVQIFLFSTAPRPALRPTLPPIQWIPGAIFPGVGINRPGREDIHSAPSGAEFKKAWRYTYTPPYVSIARRLRKHTDNFTFTYL
jgi:hypothetical protein